MRFRNHLIALVILAGFFGVAVLYFRLWVVQRPFGIILFVSDGLVARHITAARLYSSGATGTLSMERDFPYSALVRNHTLQYAVPDASSVSNAYATGRKTRHHTLAVDGRGTPLESILELARAEGRSIGIVTNGPLGGASTAAFYRHSLIGEDRAASVAELLTAQKIDVALGGGARDFLPSGKGGNRTDGRDLLNAQPWEIVRTKSELESAATYRDGRLLGVFADDRLAFSREREAGEPQPALSDLVRRAIECLQTNGRGYVLVVDETLVSHACVLNDGENTMRETVELDRAVRTAIKTAGERTLIIAAGRHSVGGFALNGYPLRDDKGLAILGPTPQGHPPITWATGPHGPASPEPSAYQTPGALNNAEDVIVLGRGIGAEKLRGYMDNTDIFKILKEGL